MRDRHPICTRGTSRPAFRSPATILAPRPYLIEYPDHILHEKLKVLTELLEERFETKMLSHRPGRWALNAIYARALAAQGYLVDSSVTPHANSVGNRPRTRLGSRPAAKLRTLFHDALFSGPRRHRQKRRSPDLGDSRDHYTQLPVADRSGVSSAAGKPDEARHAPRRLANRSYGCGRRATIIGTCFGSQIASSKRVRTTSCSRSTPPS